MILARFSRSASACLANETAEEHHTHQGDNEGQRASSKKDAKDAGNNYRQQPIDGYDTDQHIVGTIHHVEFIDDRWRNGLPNRVITLLEPPTPPDRPDPRKIRTTMVDVLDGPSTFQAEAASIQKLLRRYLTLSTVSRQHARADSP